MFLNIFFKSKYLPLLCNFDNVVYAQTATFHTNFIFTLTEIIFTTPLNSKEQFVHVTLKSIDGFMKNL